MSIYKFANGPFPGDATQAWTTVDVLLASGATALTVASAANFSAVASGEFDIVIGLRQANGTLTNAELLHVSAASGVNWTVTRTVATDHAVGESIYHVVTAEGLQHNPGSLTTSGDIPYLNASLRMARLAAPADGQYAWTFATGVPSYSAIVAAGLTVGTSPIAGGTNTRILYNNAGVLGEYTVTGTGTQAVLATAPTLTGPVTISEAVGSSGLTITGATQTTSQPVLNMTQTWNAGAVVFAAIKANVTNTSSNANSKLIDLQVGGTSYFNVLVNGSAQIYNNLTWLQGNYGSDSTYLYVPALSLTTAGTYGSDCVLRRDAANTMGQRNGTNAQTHNLYNTYTSSTNYEMFTETWSSNVLHLRTDKGSGGGTARVLQVDYGGTTTAAISVPITSGQVTLGGGLVTGGTLTHGANFLEYTEMTAPAAGAANTARVYAEDNGAGKTRLMVLFPTGAAQQIAIEP